jgi:hypothetical protein
VTPPRSSKPYDSKKKSKNNKKKKRTNMSDANYSKNAVHFVARPSAFASMSLASFSKKQNDFGTGGSSAANASTTVQVVTNNNVSSVKEAATQESKVSRQSAWVKRSAMQPQPQGLARSTSGLRKVREEEEESKCGAGVVEIKTEDVGALEMKSDEESSADRAQTEMTCLRSQLPCAREIDPSPSVYRPCSIASAAQDRPSTEFICPAQFELGITRSNETFKSSS